MRPSGPDVAAPGGGPSPFAPHPELWQRLEEPREPERGIDCNSVLSEHDLVQAFEGDSKLTSRLDLTEAQRFQELLDQDLAWRNRRPQPARVSNNLRRGLRRHVPAPTER